MRYEKVIVKQLPDSNVAAYGLEKYNKSRFPHCVDYFQAAKRQDGRHITGLDPNAPELDSLKDAEQKEEKVKELTELQKSLGEQLGVDLSATSSFWEDFVIEISTDQDLILNKRNPRDILTYYVLVSNAYAAPTKEMASHPAFIQAKYYCHVEEVEAAERVSTQRLRDQAKSKLYEMVGNKDKLFLIGSYLEGGRYKKTMGADTLYGFLSDYIEDKKNPSNIESFVKATSLPVEDLQYKVTVETAMRKKIIKFKDGQFFRGGVNLGRNAVEVLKNLKTPEFSNEFIQIHDEVNSRQ